GQTEKKVVHVCKRDCPEPIVVIQDVLPVVVDEGSQLQRVPAASVKEITTPGEDLLREVRRSSIGSHGCHAADVDGSDFFPLDKRILRADQPRGGRISGMSSAKREAERPEQRGRKNMVLRKRSVLVPAEAKSAELRIIQRVRFGRIANRVPAKKAIGRRKDLVHAPLPVVVSGRLGERKRELVFGKIRKWKQVQNGPHQRCHSSAGDAGVIGRYVASRPRHK